MHSLENFGFHLLVRILDITIQYQLTSKYISSFIKTSTYTVSSETQKCIGEASRGQLAMDLGTTILCQRIAKLRETISKYISRR